MTDLDKQMCLESLIAGIIELSKELDELESSDKITSDEECKTVENAIENNPEEAAAALPEGSDIQKEAEQAIDGGRDKEVNNDAVSKFVGMLGPKEDNVITDDGREISRDEYAAEMAQFREDNPDEILKAKEEAKESARQERAEKRAEDNKLVDMAKEVAGENDADNNTDKEDSVIDNAIDGALSVLGSIGSGTPISMGGASVPNETSEKTIDDTMNTNFSSSSTPTVSAEASGGETAATLPEVTTETPDDKVSSDKAFSGHSDAIQTNAHKVNVGSSGMLSSAGNGGTVSSGATKNSAGAIKSKEQKLPSNEAQTQEYSETLSGDEMRDTLVQNLNAQSKDVSVEGIDNEPEMSTFNGIPFDKLDNDQLKEVESLINK